MYGWDGWHAYESESGEITIEDEGGVLVTILSNKAEFIRWLEVNTAERAM